MSNPILDNRGVDPDESALGDFSVPATPAQSPALEGAMPFDESNLVDSLTTPLAETPSLADKYTGTPVVQSDTTVQSDPTVQPEQVTRTEYLGLPIPRSIDTTAPGVAPIPYKQYDAPGITPGALETLPPIDVRNLPPVLYEGPTSDDIEKQLRTNREEIRGLIEKGESPLLIENPLFLPQPQLPGGGFRPDSTRNAFDQWKIDVGLSAEYRRPDGSIDWSAAWSKMGSNAMYILGLPGNFIKAGVADLNNAVRGIALLSGGDFLAMAGGKEEVYYGRGSAVRPNFEDVGKNGANIWQALKGRQYNASDDYDPAEPFGLGEPGVPWYRDRGFWGGFLIDVLTPDILLESTVYEPLGRGIGTVFKKVAPQKLQTAVGKAGTAATRVLTTPITPAPITKLTKPLRELIGSSPIVKVASPGMQAPAVNPSANFKNGLAQSPLPSVEASGWNTRNPWTSPPDVPALKPGKPAPAPRPVPRPTNLELPIPGPPAAPRPVPIKGEQPSVPTNLFQYPDEATQNALEPIRKMFDVPGFQAITKSEGFLRDVPPIDRIPLVIDPNSANSIVRYFNPAQSRGRLVPGGPDRAIIANEVIPFSRPRPPLVGAGDVPPTPPPSSRQTLRDAIQDTLDEGWELGDGSRSYNEDLDDGLSLVYNVSRNGNVYTPSPVAVFTPNLPNLVNDPETAERIATSLLEQHNRFAQSNQYLFVSVDDVRFFKEGDFLSTIYGLGFRPYELEPDTFYNITRRLTPEELAQKFSSGEFNVKFVYEPPSARAGMLEPPTTRFPRGEGVPPRLERPKADDQAALTKMEPQMGRIEELQSRPKPTETPVDTGTTLPNTNQLIDDILADPETKYSNLQELGIDINTNWVTLGEMNRLKYMRDIIEGKPFDKRWFTEGIFIYLKTLPSENALINPFLRRFANAIDSRFDELAQYKDFVRNIKQLGDETPYENINRRVRQLNQQPAPASTQAIPEELLTNNLPDVVDYLDAPAPGHLLPEVPEVGIRSLEDINALGRFLVTNDGTPVPPFASMDELGDFVGKYPELANTLAIEGPMVPDLLKNTDVIPVVGRNNTYMLSAHTTWDNIDTVVRASIDADVDKAVQKLRSTTEKTGLLSVDSVLNWVRTQSLFDEFSTGLKQARSMVERLTVSVNNPSRYDTLPDIGRRAILDEQPFNRTVGVRGVPANAVEPMGTTFYHGTKVDIDPDDLPFIDPIAGGARGEAGPALYVTNNRNTARYYAQAPIQENVPLGDVPRDYTPGGRINQVVIPPDIKLLDAQDAADDTIYEVFKQAASDAGLPKKELTAYKSYFTRVKPDNVPKMFDKFTEYLRKSDIYDERMVLDFQRRVNTALFDLGYDGAQLPDGIALYNPAVIDTVKVVERVAESNPLNQAIARFNADSTVAAHNPRSGSSLVNMYESGVKIQANMLDQYKGRMNTLESYQTDLLNSVKQQTEALFPDVEQQLDSVEKAVKQRVDNLVQEYDANWNPCDF